MNKILIISGPTREYIDNIRFISNISSGKTGSFLADFFAEQDYEVSQLYGLNSIHSKIAKNYSFTDFQDLREKIQDILGQSNYDLVIMCAAVSDYTPSSAIVDGKNFSIKEFDKIPSGKDFELKFKKNPKLIQLLKEFSQNKEIKVVGFKLTSNASEVEAQEAVRKLFLDGHVDYVVHNDLSDISNENHMGRIFDRDKMKCVFESKIAMAKNLLKLWEKQK